MNSELIFPNKFEMTFPIFNQSFILHVGEFFRHIGSFEVEVISELLPAERNVEFS